ncbi:hypothetical protein B0T16DRAFT_455837 [Cercophora newfieldiana]|uniref:Uncharacterized protein n=1 Tax=Cercophora newfieldiana TaxID=92897 RepID=A0AA39YAG7_9PEZI|nr:hypothetical protein B0T16DRAFT_455837 [Cercophora newfieldiana]
MSHTHRRVQYVLAQLRSFDLVHSVKPSSEPTRLDLDLRPQIQWLNSHLSVVSEKLEIAKKAATEARDDTVNYVTRVVDVGERIRHIQADVETTHSGLKELASKAHLHLCSVKEDIAAIEARIKATQGEIRQRNLGLAGKRLKLLSPMFRQAVKQYQTNSARSKAEAKKSKAFQRFKTGIKGLFWAPPTLGLSLIVSVVSTSSGVTKILEYRRLNNEAEQLQTQLNRLEAEISDALGAIRHLEQQKACLEETLKQRVCELRSKNTEHEACKYQLSRGRILRAEIRSLDESIVRASEEGEKVRDTLDLWKNVFEECSIQLQNEHLKAQGHNRGLQREMRRGDAARLVHGDFERQRAVLQSVARALDGAGMDTGILVLGKKVEVIGGESWEAGRGMLVDALPMPRPCYLAS